MNNPGPSPKGLSPGFMMMFGAGGLALAVQPLGRL